MQEKVDVTIIGAGVVGAAIAERLARQGIQVLVLEKHTRVAEGTTSRNSGVIHSSIYYKPGSLKAKLCLRGKELMYDWAKKNEVPFLQTGKIILATNQDEEAELERIISNAREIGATGLEEWGAEKIKKKFNYLNGTKALFASETGIIDPYLFTKSLLDKAEQFGAVVLTNTEVHSIEKTSNGYLLSTSRDQILSEKVFNCAGLYSDKVAAMVGVNKYRIYPCRGHYFRYKTSIPFTSLVYPVKAKGAAGLGIHLTLDLSGGKKLGPDTEYIDSVEDYSPHPNQLELRREQFRKAAEKLFGPTSIDQIEFDQCGIRPKIRPPEGKEELDFVLEEDLPGFVNCIGIESPGLTSSLAIAEYLIRD